MFSGLILSTHYDQIVNFHKPHDINIRDKWSICDISLQG